MRRTTWLCLLAAFLGGCAGSLLWHSADVPAVQAQTPALAELPRRGAAAPGQPLSEARFAPLPPDPGTTGLTSEEQVNVAVYENCNRSVVNLSTRSVREDNLFFFDSVAEGGGSGFVFDRAGHLITNYHVVDHAREIQITLFDGSSYSAQVVGQDAYSDIAVLKIDAPPELLYPVALGDSSLLRVGQRVFAIGNPFGLERTLTTGIISSLNRTLPGDGQRPTIRSAIQIDAAINPGNSGGPLLDSRGQLIGMNTAIASATGQSSGVGFAIPSNSIQRAVLELIEHGQVIRPDSGIARVYETDRGLLIAALLPGGAAERAGLRGPKIVVERRRQGVFVVETQRIDRAAADLIVAVDGQPVKKGDDFLAVIEAKKPGDEVVVTVIRGEVEVDVPVVLDAPPRMQ